MGFGVLTHGADGHAYDSQSEERVSRVLQDLREDHVVAKYMAHPRLAGIEFDFLVQVGDACSASDGTRAGDLLLIEYDGLAEARQADLSLKFEKHAALRQLGIDVRWLMSLHYDAVRQCIESYSPPHFVTKTMMCSCGAQRKIVVAMRKKTDITEIDGSFRCPDCTLHDHSR